MKHLIRVALCLAAWLLAGSMAWADASTLPVATLNAHKILSDSRVAKEAQARFRADFEPRDKEIQDLAASLRDKSADLEKNGPSLTPSHILEKQSAIAELSRELKRKQQQFVEDRDARKRDDIQHVFDIANQAVKKFAATAHVDIVFQDVVYANPQTDITPQVIAIMDSDTFK
ncbi:OmpH family outer membrane protein [Rhodoferax sp. GW822-FHT02A01]|uniref:OmpH family outer membrane protein n=1 Tax=Rhodoferax sp. GW822-FHT02A01 TaxID=3141537 RepID=UPI00315DCF03